MRLRLNPAVGVMRNQGGFALIAVLSLAALISAYLITTALNPTSSDLIREREQRSMNALRQAKAALIAYAASERWQQSLGQASDQPGGLPCPDDNDSGTSAGALCSAIGKRLGRLPWVSIGADDLRDASGERLWYAVSSNFYKTTANVINSDTPGLLTVTGSAPVSNVVAVVIAPGDAILGQDRVANHNSAAAYLEGFSTSALDYTFNTISSSSGIANDRVLAITQEELMAVVEPVVAARIERDVKPYLLAYFNQWGAFPGGLANPFQPGRYPFPAKFDNPDPGTNRPLSTRAQDAYVGDVTKSNGLLPITSSLTYPWTAGSGSASLTGGLAGSISGVSCNTVALPGWQCSFFINSVDLGPNPADWGPCTDGSFVKWRYCMVNPRFAVQGDVGANAGISFANLPDASSVTVTNATGTPRPMSAATINGTLTSAGVGSVIFKGTWAPSSRYSASAFSRSMVVTIPDVQVSALTSLTNPITGWFIVNEWFRQTYFAVAPGYLPGGSGSCFAPNCITANNLPPGYAPASNKRAILVLSGRALNGAIRPTANLGDYFEGENSTPADRTYEHRAGSIGLTTLGVAINDRVVVLAP